MHSVLWLIITSTVLLLKKYPKSVRGSFLYIKKHKKSVLPRCVFSWIVRPDLVARIFPQVPHSYFVLRGSSSAVNIKKREMNKIGDETKKAYPYVSPCARSTRNAWKESFHKCHTRHSRRGGRHLLKLHISYWDEKYLADRQHSFNLNSHHFGRARENIYVSAWLHSRMCFLFLCDFMDARHANRSPQTSHSYGLFNLSSSEILLWSFSFILNYYVQLKCH